MKLRFDHSYTADLNFRFRKRLKESGFFLADYEVEHPGKHFCRFIMLPHTQKTGYQYLEFIHWGKGGAKVTKPGLSFSAPKELEPFAKKLQAKKVDLKFYHKNYDWKINDTDHLPGWNFVDFPKRKSKIYTWLTEYERPKNRKRRQRKPVQHPNQVYKIVAVESILDAADVNFFTKLFGRPVKNEFQLGCGTPFRFTTGKSSRINSYVLATKDLNRFVKKFSWDELTTYQGQPAVRIKNPNPKMWDLVIVEG